MTQGTSHKFTLLFAGLVIVTCVVIIVSSGMGYMQIPVRDILQVLYGTITGNRELLDGLDKAVPIVVMDVRLPRILTAALVGGGLALSGVIYQGILLNPLADPYTLGVSSGAAFGASIALLANILFSTFFSVPLFAFAGAVATLFVVLHLSNFQGRISANTLILSGVIIGAILSAAISFVQYLADKQVAVIIFWLMGSFSARSWGDVTIVAAAVCLGLFITFYYSRDLNIMSLGGRSADSLGVETGRTRMILLVTASMVTAVCVAVSGIIGFIGLIVPHLMRFLVGPDNRKLLPVSLLGGATLLLVADTVTRALLPSEVPIGVLTALIGGPFFCVIFRRRQKRGTHG